MLEVNYTNFSSDTFFLETVNSSRNSTNGSNVSYDSSSTAFPIAIFLFILCVFGACGNVLSIFVFTRRSMRSSINVLLTGLSVIDLSVLAATIPSFVLIGLNTYGHLGDLSYLEFVVMFGFYQCGLMAQTCSVYAFVLISLERYLAVCRPFHVHRLLTVRRAKCALLCVAVFAIGYNSVRFWEYALCYHENCTFGYERSLRSNEAYFVGYYTVAYVIVHFFMPFILIIFLNVHIVKTISNADDARRQLMPAAASRNRASVRNTEKRQRRTTRMIVMVTFIFALCNTLPFILNIWEAVCRKLFNSDNALSPVAFLMLDISNVLVVCNSSTNCIIYWVYCKQYRSICMRHMWSLFSYCCGGSYGASMQKESVYDFSVDDGNSMARSKASSEDYRSTFLSVLTQKINSRSSAVPSYAPSSAV